MDTKTKSHFSKTAQLVRNSRKKKEISQGALAKAVGFHDGQFVSNIERGLCTVPLKKVAVMAKALDIEVTLLTDAIVADFSSRVTAGVEERGSV